MSEEEVKMYTLNEIEEHNSKDSLWVLIADKVYDLTKFLNEHPGGPEILEDFAGKDASDAFEDAGHSLDAREMMMDYEIGELSETDRKEKKVYEIKSNGFCWRAFIIPVGVMAAAFLIYQFYNRLHK